MNNTRRGVCYVAVLDTECRSPGVRNAATEEEEKGDARERKGFEASGRRTNVVMHRRQPCRLGASALTFSRALQRKDERGRRSDSDISFLTRLGTEFPRKSRFRMRSVSGNGRFELFRFVLASGRARRPKKKVAAPASHPRPALFLFILTRSFCL